MAEPGSAAVADLNGSPSIESGQEFPAPPHNIPVTLIPGPRHGDSLIEYEPITPRLPDSIASPSLENLELIDLGGHGSIYRISEFRVIKVPRSNPPDQLDTYTLQNEVQVYQRLGSHRGIIHCFNATNNSIELTFANQGNLHDYIHGNPMPSEAVRREWMKSLTDAFAHAHSRRVAVTDIHLRNVLVHDSTLKLVDFGHSLMLPLNADMERFYVCSCKPSFESEPLAMYRSTPDTEAFYLGCLLYSIAAWEHFDGSYDHDNPPLLDDLPDTLGVLGEEVIIRCWMGRYPSMAILDEDMKSL